MNAPVGAIAGLVDRLLARHGVYRPVDMLVELRRLPEAALADWRRDASVVLEDRLLGDPDRSIESLEHAARWAERLGLARELKIPAGPDGQPLTAARRPGLQQLLLTEYQRVDDGPQLDLFFDNPKTGARNRLVGALRDGDAGAAGEALSQFETAGAGHAELTAAETLVDALGWPGDVAPSPADGLAFIDSRVQPAAVELLGRNAADFVRLFWARLAETADPERFDPDRPKLHPSWFFRQAGDWARVIDSARAVGGFWRDSILLARLAEAGIALGDRALALAALAELCWRDAEAAGQWLQQIEDPIIAALCDRFWDLEPELDIALLPAWLALHLPAPAPLAEATQNNDPARAAYATARALGRKPGDIELRKTLHAQCPALMAHWLRR